MNGLNFLPSYTDYFHLITATFALNTASVWVGSTLSGIIFAQVPDLIGLKWTLFVSAIITLVGVVIQTAAQSTAMFIVSRIIIGLSTGGSTVAGPFDFWYVGGLIAAGVTYGTAKMDSTWAWRLPSALQGLFSLLGIGMLPFAPESPRWLQSQGRDEDALLYPPEVLNFSIRSTGMGPYTFLTNGVGLMVTFAFPFALESIGWKTYMINGAWDVFKLAFVLVYWVETKGRTLEEIDDSLDQDAAKLKTIHGIQPKDEEAFVQDLHSKSKGDV
ncbi:Fc.00g074290.m01.CDS01 [Cosmosporella sp. VM-42]